MDWPLHQYAPEGPKEFYRRACAPSTGYSDGHAAGVFFHDFKPRSVGRLGPWGTRAWMDEAKAWSNISRPFQPGRAHGASDDHPPFLAPRGVPVSTRREFLYWRPGLPFLDPLDAPSQATRGSGLLHSAAEPGTGRRPLPRRAGPRSGFGPALWQGVSCRRQAPSRRLRLGPRGILQLEDHPAGPDELAAHKPLKETVESERKGAKRRMLAAGYGLDYNQLYEASLAVEELVRQEYLPRFPEPDEKERGDQ